MSRDRITPPLIETVAFVSRGECTIREVAEHLDCSVERARKRLIWAAQRELIQQTEPRSGRARNGYGITIKGLAWLRVQKSRAA